MFLRDVKYRLYGEFDFIPPDQWAKVFNPVPEWLIDAGETDALRQPDNRADETEAKYAAMFERRAKKGQCFNQPYFGCREFSCEYKLVDCNNSDPSPIGETRNLNWMLYDMDFSDPANPKAMWFCPEMKKGTIIVPHPDSEEVRK